MENKDNQFSAQLKSEILKLMDSINSSLIIQ